MGLESHGHSHSTTKHHQCLSLKVHRGGCNVLLQTGTSCSGSSGSYCLSRVNDSHRRDSAQAAVGKSGGALVG